MYGWIFRHLPGPTWFKVVEALVIISLIIFALFTWAYPLVHSYLNSDLTVTPQS